MERKACCFERVNVVFFAPAVFLAWKIWFSLEGCCKVDHLFSHLWSAGHSTKHSLSNCVHLWGSSPEVKTRSRSSSSVISETSRQSQNQVLSPTCGTAPAAGDQSYLQPTAWGAFTHRWYTVYDSWQAFQLFWFEVGHKELRVSKLCVFLP